jgi:hypothetical protein
MNKPAWFEDEVKRISRKREISLSEAENSILARIENFATRVNGDMTAAYEAYNLERIDSIDEDDFIEIYMKEHGVTEEVARAAFKSLPF